MIRSFRSKALKRFAETGDGSRLSVRNIDRVTRIVKALSEAATPQEMNVSGYNLHPLKGADRGRWSVWVTGNYRITFGWSGQDAIDVDLEDYH